MENEHCFVYCKRILGVKTNIHSFKWVYGSVAPTVSSEEYEKCVVKFNVYVKPEKELNENSSCDKRFQAFSWNAKNNTIYYRRTFLSNLKVGYNISFAGNTVEAHIGERYFKLIKNRMMNLHGVYYLLSDIANMMLLSNGYLTLYASAMCFEQQKKGVVCFAPPNTGKTITATKLCELPDCGLLGEDVIITDGKHLFACPWTNSYRKNNGSFDNAGSFGRANKANNLNTREMSDLTDLFVLSLGEKRMLEDKNEVLRQICILNGYLFNYYSSPIIKVLGYFDKEYCESWNARAEELLIKMVNDNNCRELQAENALDFWKLIHSTILGENL